MVAPLAIPAGRGSATLTLKTLAPYTATGLAFLVLFATPMATLVRDWWSDPDANHGLLLGPIAIFLAWRGGVVADARGRPVLGLLVLAGAVFLRYLSALAAEPFSMRMSMLLAAAALVIFALGLRQILHWWLPGVLLALSVPVPDIIVGTLALPLQLKASQMGAFLLEWRHVPVHLAGNVIHLPGRSLFVTEACSGLRSLTALAALGVMMGGIWLRRPWTRLTLLAAVIPIAMLLNGLRVFVTGFSSYFLDPRLGEGLMHYTQGWALFVVAFAAAGLLTWILGHFEHARGATQ